jgi:carbamoyltransferase
MGQFARQLASRLRNAAKVRDLKNELAKEPRRSKLIVSAPSFTTSSIIAHTLASAFFVSPFDRARRCCRSTVSATLFPPCGPWERGNSIKVLGQIEYPHSLGIVYTATTQFLGFPHYGDEGKVMGLAPYGRPRFIDRFGK